MSLSLMHRYRNALSTRRWRRLFLALATVVLLVQTGFPAHQDTHPIGSHDLCQYCFMVGHAFGVPTVALLVPTPPVHAEYRAVKPAEFHVTPFPRTRFSRGPPLNSYA